MEVAALDGRTRDTSSRASLHLLVIARRRHAATLWPNIRRSPLPRRRGLIFTALARLEGRFIEHSSASRRAPSFFTLLRVLCASAFRSSFWLGCPNDQTGLVADFASRVEAVTDFSARAGVTPSWASRANRRREFWKCDVESL